ncbi:hypothetical protein Avbf_16588 [Armadillidium vulgare]|nr:hypothetical protein Avbf_16588 [Armadillidium vulgare]
MHFLRELTVTELCVSLDDHIFYSGKSKDVPWALFKLKQGSFEGVKGCLEGKTKYRTYLLAPLM